MARDNIGYMIRVDTYFDEETYHEYEKLADSSNYEWAYRETNIIGSGDDDFYFTDYDIARKFLTKLKNIGIRPIFSKMVIQRYK